MVLSRRFVRKSLLRSVVGTGKHVYVILGLGDIFASVLAGHSDWLLVEASNALLAGI